MSHRRLWTTGSLIATLAAGMLFALIGPKGDAQSQSAQQSNVAQPIAPIAPPKPPDQCFQYTDKVSEIRRSGPSSGGGIVLDAPFLNTGSAIEVGLDEAYEDRLHYFAALVSAADPDKREIIDTRFISYLRSQDSDTLVRKRLLAKDRVILRMTFEDGVAEFWQAADLYIYRCAGSPVSVSQRHVYVSSLRSSTAVTWVSLITAYLLAALAFGSQASAVGAGLSIINPIKLTAGPDGKGSLAKLQIFFFSLIVFGLSVFFLLRTGLLSNLSSTVLLLLGITGFGSTISKGIDAQRTLLHSDNQAWLASKSSLPQPSQASWTDLVTTDGEFDVYRYQSLIFSFAVGVGLVASGVSQLASFTIPDNLLGILGLSQAVYIGGKLVTPTAMIDLNGDLKELRGLEGSFRSAVLKQNSAFVGTVEQAQTIARAEYDRYADKARAINAKFGIEVRLDPPDAKF